LLGCKAGLGTKPTESGNATVFVVDFIIVLHRGIAASHFGCRCRIQHTKDNASRHLLGQRRKKPESRTAKTIKFGSGLVCFCENHIAHAPVLSHWLSHMACAATWHRRAAFPCAIASKTLFIVNPCSFYIIVCAVQVVPSASLLPASVMALALQFP
jgi:hypothetical protein